MKTSNKLLILAVLILFGTLTAYDFALRAEYRKGTYKDPFRNYTRLNNKAFDTIQINGANRIGVHIEYTDTFDIRVSNNARKFIKITQKGQLLIVDLDFQKGDMVGYVKDLYIRCPAVKMVKTDAIFSLDGKKTIAKDNGSEYRHFLSTVIEGFKLDSLSLSIDNSSYVNLTKNQINYLKTDIGVSKDSQSGLRVEKNNLIRSANLNLSNFSELVLEDVVVNNFKYSISDSSTVKLNGASLKLMQDNGN